MFKLLVVACLFALVINMSHFTKADSSCDDGDWYLSFDKQGWSKCSSSYSYISGLTRSDVKANNYALDYIHHLEGAKCCKGYGEFACDNESNCKQVSWKSTIGSPNSWSNCPTGYFLNGLYRSAGGNVHNIEQATCCKPKTAPERYGLCYKEDVWSAFDYDKTGTVSCSKPGYYITGLFRSRCDLLYCIEEFLCCSMAEPTNVALKKTTIQSSTAWVGLSGRAVDGVIATSYSFGSCTHTSLSNSPWWRVDLGKEYEVLYFRITNRGDCCSERLSGFEIRIGNSLIDNGNQNPRCGGTYSLQSAETRKIVCPAPVKGRYVNVRIPGHLKYLTLCEVEVYA